MSWQLDTTRHVKIWFSDNPNQWTYQTNQLRLIRHRALHPKHTIHLFGCLEILSPKSQTELHAFCSQHKIKYHDIKEVQPTDDTERPLLIYANKEIKSAVTGQGGCLATASDILRLFDAILNLGIYSDLDVELDFRHLPQTVEIEDFLIDWSCSASSGNRHDYYIQNSFIAAPVGHEVINLVKGIVLNNYRDGIFVGGGQKPLEKLKDDGIFDRRKLLQQKLSAAYAVDDWEQYSAIIIKLAGPKCFKRAIDPYLSKKHKFVAGSYIPPYLYEKLQYKEQLLKKSSAETSSHITDVSWAPGNKSLAEQEAQMHVSATTIQKCWRHHSSNKVIS